MPNPAPYFEQVVWQLTKAEWVALCQFHSGMSASPPDPFDGADNHSPFGLTAHWQWVGHLATATHTTAKTLMDAHRVLFDADVDSYLSPGVTDLTRRARLVNGAWLIEEDDKARSPGVTGLCYKMPRQPKPSGWWRTPWINWSGAGSDPFRVNSTAFLKVWYENLATGAEASSTVAATIVAAIEAMPAGFRTLQWNTPTYKKQIDHSPPGGGTAPYRFVFYDGQRSGGWPGFWIDQLAAELETTLGGFLDALVTAGLEGLDYFVTDIEPTINVDDLNNPAQNYPHPDYRTNAGTVENPIWLDEAGRTWHEHLRWMVANSQAAWAATYKCPSLVGIENASLDSAQALQLCQTVVSYQRTVLRTAIRAVIRDRFPDCEVLEYDDTGKAPTAITTPQNHRKRYASTYGAGAMYSDRCGRNLYQFGIGSAWFPSLGEQSVATTPWSAAVADLDITSNSNVIASRLKQCPHVTPYKTYIAINPLTTQMAYAHHLATALLCNPAHVVWWSNQPTLEEQDLLHAASVAASTIMHGVMGRVLPRPDRGNWNVTEDINLRFLAAGKVIDVNIPVTLGDAVPTGSVTSSERTNEINMAPVLDQPASQTAEVSALFQYQMTAADPDHNYPLTFSLINPPGGMTINASSGLISWTPDTPLVANVTVRVTDSDADDPLSDEVSFQVTVSGAPANTAPTVNLISAQNATEGVLFTLQCSAEDAEDDTITWSLSNNPSGMTIGSGTGLISWTPSEAQAPAVYSVTVIATDDGTPNLSGTRNFSLTVAEANVAPVLAPIANQNVNEHALLEVTANATDADVPAQAIAYTLVSPPSGMTINSSTGLIQWTPNETQGSVTPYTITVRATDALGGTTTTSFQVTVAETNTAPVIDPIPDKGGTINSLLTFQVVATDSDSPAQTLTYTLTGSPPAGAAIDANTGVFSWTPGEGQLAGSPYSITVRVTDNGSNPASLYDEDTFTVTLSSDNVAPVLAVIPTKEATPLVELEFTAEATDANAGDALTFSLVGEPDGAEIDPNTGEFTWTPALEDEETTVEFTVVVTDDGTPNFSDSQTVTVNVGPANHPPALNSVGDRLIYVGKLFRTTITATDAGGSQELVFSADNLPEGATLDPGTGEFEWTPLANQVGDFPITFHVTDGVDSDSETVTIRSVHLRASTGGRYVRFETQRTIQVEAGGDATMQTWEVTRGDAADPLRMVVVDKNTGDAVDLSGMSAEFRMVVASTGTVVVNDAAAVVENAASGVLRYDWAAGDIDTAGQYFGCFILTNAQSETTRYPQGQRLMIDILEPI